MTKLAMLTALSASLVGACADRPDDGDPSSAEIASAIEQDDGGFTTTDEAAQFADPAAFAAVEADTPVTDTMASMLPDAGANHVLVLWGKLPADRDATDIRDWSGTLSVSSGTIRATRAVAFEDRTDGLLPRTAPEVVAFTSRTRPAADGLALSVMADAAATPQILTYASDAGDQYDIDLASLASGPQRIDAGNGFSIVALSARAADDNCRGGFMRGRWHQVDDDRGAFAGRVVNRRGEEIGHVRGIYGHRKDGSPVMFGKFIGEGGAFLGIMKGTYENGHYTARWIDRAGEHGRLGGMYFDGPSQDDGRGGFVGRWAETGCAQD